MEVLVVEDDDDLRELEATIVKAAGHTALEAADGEAAVRTFENSDCAVVILDWMLPDLSGIQVAKALQEIRYAYVIMVTAMTKRKNMEEALKAGASDYIQKPFVPDEFIECLGVGEAIITARDRLMARLDRLGVEVEM
jgi:two-component system phosphate regulon response regulator PhoB